MNEFKSSGYLKSLQSLSRSSPLAFGRILKKKYLQKKPVQAPVVSSKTEVTSDTMVFFWCCFLICLFPLCLESVVWIVRWWIGSV